jgi:hypothetical protein
MRALRWPLRGYIMGLVLTLGGLALYQLLFCASQTSDFTILRQQMSSISSLDAALGLEETALAKILYDPNWSESLSREVQKPSTSSTLTFNSKGAEPYSTNNSASFAGATGWGARVVPPGYTHLATSSSSRDGYRLRHQSLVNAYTQYYLEDFGNPDRSAPDTPCRNKWTFEGKHKIKDGYCFLKGEEKGAFAESGEAWWEDYDLEAIVAYYGENGFGLLVRSESFNGYCVRIAPVHARSGLNGGSIRFTSVKGAPAKPDWNLLTQDVIFSPDYTAPSPSVNEEISYSANYNPLVCGPNIKKDDKGYPVLSAEGYPKLDFAMGFWKIQASVENWDKNGAPSAMPWLSVMITRLEHRNVKGLCRLAETKDVLSFKAPQPAGKDLQCLKGKIGFFCEAESAIGFTNVIVRKRGLAMVSIPSRWVDRY